MSQSPDSSRPIHALPRSTWAFALAALGILALVCRTGLGKMVEAWLGSEEYSHAILIPFIAGFLVWQRKDLLGRTPMRGSWAGFALVGFGCALLLLGRLSALLVVQQYALLVVVYGLVLGLAGWQVVRLLAMPLLLLLFMVPLPQFLLQDFSAKLQLISSQFGVVLIRLLGISVFLEGNVIDLGAYKLEVAQACSGLRYLFPLMTIGLILAYFYQGAAWKRTVVFLSSIPITILMNSFRVGVIGVLVEFWGPRMAQGFIHDAEGWVVFMASLGVLVLEIRLLARVGGDRRPWREVLGLGFPEPLPASTGRIEHPLPRPLVASALLLALLAGVIALLPERAQAAPARSAFAGFPDQLGPWQGQRRGMEREYLDALKLDDYLLADYARPGMTPVNFYVAWYNSQAAGESVHSPRSCIPGGGWRITEFGQRDLAPLQVYGKPLRVNRAVIEYGTQRQLVYYLFMQRGRVLTNEYLVKWYLFQDSIQRHRSDGALVRFVLPLKAGQSPDDGDAELRDFVGAAVPNLGTYVPG
ncbi:MAG: VPLPA-CTERM-specific exosortase XrtD [Nevskia sp.]|nr:VPLPA-CTERM-specific exosortase XrtD [Nevskia sp.]